MGLFGYVMASVKKKGVYVHTFYKASDLLKSAPSFCSMECLAAADH
jgi:hypothetical protein